VIDHGVVVRALPAASLTDALGLGVRAKVHVGEIHPEKHGLARGFLALEEVH